MTLVKDRKFYISLLTLALPAALQQLVSLGLNLADNVMVGSLGETALGAVSQANRVATFMMMFIKGVSAGTAVLISQYWGKRDLPRIKNIFAVGIQTSLFVALIFWGLAYFLPREVLGFLTDNPALIDAGIPYLRIAAWSYLLYAVSENLIVMLRSVEVVRVALWVSTASLLINVAGNYVLIFGRLGFPALGAQGAAIATVFARACELAIVIGFLIFRDTRLKLRLRDVLYGSREIWGRFLRYGLPLVAADVSWGLVGLLKGVIIGRLGTDAVAAGSIADTMLDLVMMFMRGIAAASGVLIGKTVGTREYDKTRAYAKTLQVIFFGFGILAAGLTFLCRAVMVDFYSVSAATKDAAREFLLYGAATIWGTGYAAGCFQGINRGAGDVKFVLRTNLVCGFGLVLPLAALGAFVWGCTPAVVYFFTRIDQIVKVPLAYFRLRGKRWITNVTER